MKTVGGYIGWIVGMIIGGLTNVSAIVLIAAIVCCLIGRFIGKCIDEDRERKKREAYEEQRRREREELAQRRKAQEEYEKKLKAERKAQAQALARKYPDATRYFFQYHWGIMKSDITDSDITDDKVESLLSQERYFERSVRTRRDVQAIIDAEQEEKRKKENARLEAARKRELARKRAEEERRNLSTILPTCVSKWYTHTYHGSIKHKWFVDYYPYNRYKDDADSSMREDWRLVWDFKNDYRISSYDHSKALNKVIELTENALKAAFNGKVKYLTLVCLTASTNEATKDRYEDFSNRVCADLGMENGLNHIHIVSDAVPKHLGGNGRPKKQYDERFFKEKYVILFDDVRTSGASLELEKEKMMSMGAMVIGAITIAQTVS